jgi:hypothetical protein
VPVNVTCLLLAAASAQTQPTAGLESYARAREVLEAGIQAVGGADVLGELRTVRRDLVDDWVDVGQGERPLTGTPDLQSLPPHDGFDDSEVLSFFRAGPSTMPP